MLTDRGSGLVFKVEAMEILGVTADPWRTVRNHRERYLKSNPGRELEIVKLANRKAGVKREDLLHFADWRKGNGYNVAKVNSSFGTVVEWADKERAEVLPSNEWEEVQKRAYEQMKKDIASMTLPNGDPVDADRALALIGITSWNFPRKEPPDNWSTNAMGYRSEVAEND